MTDEYLDPGELRPEPVPQADPLTRIADALESLVDLLGTALGMEKHGGEERPAGAAGLDVEAECEHPRDRRQSLASIGDEDGVGSWYCRDCGHAHT